MIQKKMIQPDDKDTLNPMADICTYATGTEDGMKPETNINGEELNEHDGEKSKPYPNETALPKEQDDNDEFVLKQ